MSKSSESTPNDTELGSTDLFCCKCCSRNISTVYIREGKLITAFAKSRKKSEFLRYIEYDYSYTVVAAKEHLQHTCRNCQFSWRGNTADSKQNAQEHTPK